MADPDYDDAPAVYARAVEEGTSGLDSILAYSAICAGGVDTVPLARDAREDAIARIIGDVAKLAFNEQTPYGQVVTSLSSMRLFSR